MCTQVAVCMLIKLKAQHLDQHLLLRFSHQKESEGWKEIRGAVDNS